MIPEIPGTEKSGMFLAAGDNLEKATGVLLGCPLDDTGSFRTGSRFAPASLRMVSAALEEHSLSRKKDLRDLSFYDGGDLILAPGNTEASLDVIGNTVFSLLRKDKKFLLGGEHTVTYGAVRGCLREIPGLTVLYLDAHADMRSPTEGALFPHASVAYYLRQLKGVSLCSSGSVPQIERKARSAGRKHHCLSLRNL